MSWLASAFEPVVQSARGYSPRKLRCDAQAGLTVAALELPQAMAYAVIAGVPPEYGIYTSIIQGVIGALLSSSNHLASGPTNTQSLLIASAATRLAGSDPALYLQMVFGLAMIKGIIQLLFAAGGLGQMVRYVSRSVILGLMAGAGLLIAAGQLPVFLGLPGHASGQSSPLPGILGQIHVLVSQLGQINLKAVTIGLISLAIILGCRWLSRKLPGAILAVVLSAALVALLGWSSSDLSLVGAQPGKLPSFHIPDLTLEQTQQLFSGALALAILGMLESVAIVKSISSQTQERINPNREFFAQGISNFISSFFNGIPGSGSFTRSALNHAAGAQTRFAALLCAGFVALAYFMGSGLIQHLPMACLAAILLIIAFNLIQWREILRTVATNREDAIVCLTTLVATLIAPLEYAIFIGVFLNIALFVRRSSRLQMIQMVTTGPDHNQFIEEPIRDTQGQQSVLFLQMEGNLFFGVADELEDRLSRVAGQQVPVVIIRLKRTSAIDSTVLHVMEQFIRQMQSQNGHVLLCGVKPDLYAQLKAYGLVDLLGEKAVFPASHDVYSSARQALAYARTLTGDQAELKATAHMAEPDDWSAYSI